MNEKNNNGFFEWLVGLFKEKKPVVIQPTPEELAEEARWIMIKSKYSLEFLKEHGSYFVRYRWRDQWWYLRRWDEDYTLERVRGNAIRIKDPLSIDQVIKLHQEWIGEGHIHLNFD